MTHEVGAVKWNPWKLATIGVLVVFATALVTGIVVANYTGRQQPGNQEQANLEPPSQPQPNPPQANPQPPNQAPPKAAVVPPPPPREAQGRRVAARPSSADIEDCNRYARAAHDKATEALKGGLLGAAIGAGLGAAGGAIADGGSGAGKGAGIGGLVGAVGGSLYGLDQANRDDQAATAAYRACMKRRGYYD